MPTLKNPKIVGRVICYECKKEINLRQNVKGHFYYRCVDDRKNNHFGCGEGHDYTPDITDINDIGGYVKPVDDPPPPVEDNPAKPDATPPKPKDENLFYWE